MACVIAGEELTDEPFKRHLTPMEVAHAIQSALPALWLSAPAAERSPAALERAALRMFADVEQWWLRLKDRTGAAVVSAMQQAFAIPESVRAEYPHKMETLIAFLPSQSFAGALFWAWLLQPEHTRTPAGTARTVRRILERQLRAAAEDVVTFAVEVEVAR
jgi:hypothetical protein